MSELIETKRGGSRKDDARCSDKKDFFEIINGWGQVIIEDILWGKRGEEKAE